MVEPAIDALAGSSSFHKPTPADQVAAAITLSRTAQDEGRNP
jgi:hypothetical protein